MSHKMTFRDTPLATDCVATEKLNLTPSAVSHGLSRLRRLLHDPLFLKTSTGVKPTERAIALAGPIAEEKLLSLIFLVRSISAASRFLSRPFLV